VNDLSNDLLNSVPLQNPEGTLDELVQAYYKEISSIINKHAPLYETVFTRYHNIKSMTADMS
jgi:hypothetical protein